MVAAKFTVKITMQTKILIPTATGLFLLGACLLAPSLVAQERGGTDDPKRWQAVAPGRVEPWSGEIKITAAAIGAIGELLVKPNDKVFAGELLIRLRDEEVVTRVATAEAQVAMRKRARNDQTASNRVADRRRAEDLVSDAERAVVDTRAAIDTASIARRAGTGSEGDIQAARACAHAREREAQAGARRPEAVAQRQRRAAAGGSRRAAQHRARRACDRGGGAREADDPRPDRRQRAADQRQDRRARQPLGAQPLIVLGDVSGLRVRAEVDERDFGDIKIGQAVLVRTSAFRGREIAGKVSSIAPVVDAGRINLRGQRNMTDVNVVEVVIDLTEPGPLAVGMKVDVYFRLEGQ